VLLQRGGVRSTLQHHELAVGDGLAHLLGEPQRGEEIALGRHDQGGDGDALQHVPGVVSVRLENGFEEHAPVHDAQVPQVDEEISPGDDLAIHQREPVGQARG